MTKYINVSSMNLKAFRCFSVIVNVFLFMFDNYFVFFFAMCGKMSIFAAYLINSIYRT